MPYLVDASNLGGVLGGRRGSRDAESVVKFLLPWASGRGRIVAVFDGPPRDRVAERYGGLEVAWSGARSADQAIEARVRRDPQAWTVVTSDRELARRCRDLGARTEPASRLVERVERPHPRSRRAVDAAGKPEPDPRDLAHWRRVFGDGGDGGR